MNFAFSLDVLSELAEAMREKVSGHIVQITQSLHSMGWEAAQSFQFPAGDCNQHVTFERRVYMRTACKIRVRVSGPDQVSCQSLAEKVERELELRAQQ